MKSIIIFLLICLYPLSVFAIIDETKTDIYFANGILTEKPEAIKNLFLIKENISIEQYNHLYAPMYKELNFDTSYNETHSFSGDIIESFLQKISQGDAFDEAAKEASAGLLQTAHEKDLDIQVKAYRKSISHGHKVLVVAHSQGNLFTYEAYRKLDPWMQSYFEPIGVASPAHFSIKDEISISWDNDLVALLGLYGSSHINNPIRKVSWDAVGQFTKEPYFHYLPLETVGDTLNDAWKSSEPFWKYDSNVHSFSFYMGEPLKLSDTNETVINPFTDKTITTQVTKKLIMKSIKTKLDILKQTPSQWKTDQEFKKDTKDYRITLKHISDENDMDKLLKDIKVYPFNTKKGKLYQAQDLNGSLSYVKASFGGEKIQDSWSGQDEDNEFYKITGTDSVEYIKGKIVQCIPLPKTGQTTVYTNYDDGHYQKGAEVEPRFVRDSTKEIVKDHVTGLIWQDDIEAATVKTKSRQESIEYCEALTLGEFIDWRLPSIEELVHITDKGRTNPAIDLVFEHISSSNYWSSTIDRHYDLSWFVRFDNGIDGIYRWGGGSNHVRCVRDVQ